MSKPSLSEIFHALTGSLSDDYDPDRCSKILFDARPEDMEEIEELLESALFENDGVAD